jgi:hypothetical protein
VSVAAQVDFKRRRGVYRSAITALDPAERGFKDIDPERHELWQKILSGVDDANTVVRLQRDAADLNAADGDVLETFLRFGQTECPADRYVVSFFGHAAGPLGVFSDQAPGEAAHDTLRLPGPLRQPQPRRRGGVPRLLHELPRGDSPAARVDRLHRRHAGAGPGRGCVAVEGIHGVTHARRNALRRRPGSHEGARGLSG